MAKRVQKGATALYPTPVVVVTCALPGGKPNGITVAWTGIVCSNPPLLAVSLRPQRYSYDIICQTGQFVVNVPSAAQAQGVDRFGTVSGRDADKFELTGFTPEPATCVQAPLIREFPVNLECQVRERLLLGTHEMFIGEILAVHTDEACLNQGDAFDTEKAAPIVFIPMNGEYRALGGVVGTYGFSDTAKS